MDLVNIIVQARMMSVRLPGKMMLDLNGEPILQRILTRLTQCNFVNNIVLAIPDNTIDNILSDVAGKVSGVKVVRGSEENLIERFQKANELFPSQFVIRFPGDNVFPDPKILEQLIKFHIEKNPKGFSSNIASVLETNIIDGVGGEMFSSEILKNLSPSYASRDQKEHLHLNFYNYRTREVVNPSVKVDTPTPSPFYARPEFALDINTIDQYPLIRDIYGSVCKNNPYYTTADIIQYLDNRD